MGYTLNQRRCAVRMRYFWIILGCSSVALGIAGVILPLVPTTPFLLLAAYAFSKSSARLHQWLVHHPQLGPPIMQWRQHRAVSKKTKLSASVSLIVLFTISIVMQVPSWLLLTQVAVLTGVGWFLWTRPGPPPAPGSIRRASADAAPAAQTQTVTTPIPSARQNCRSHPPSPDRDSPHRAR